MGNNRTLVIIGFSSLLILFNFVVFFLPLDKTTTFWIAYVFTSIALIQVVVVSYLVLVSKVSLKDKFLNFSLIQISYRYFISQFVLGLVLFALVLLKLDQEYFYISIIGMILSVGFLGFTITKLSISKLGINEVERLDKEVGNKVDFIKKTQLTVEQLAYSTKNATLKKEFSKLIETIRYSDPMSNESSKLLDDKIITSTEQLKLNFEEKSNDDVMIEIERINQLFQQRNTLIKYKK